MTKILRTEVECPYCHTRSKSGIGFGTTDDIKNNTVSGNTQTCPGCGKTITSDKQNLRVQLADLAGTWVDGDKL